MDTFPDLGSLSDQELKDLIQQLTDEELEVSYKRRILHGKIDILRAELVNRLRKKHEGGEDVITGADVEKLTDILAGKGRLGQLRGVAGAAGSEPAWPSTAPSAASSTPRAPTTARSAAAAAAASGEKPGGDPTTATYRVGETGELEPVEIEDVVAHGAALVIRSGGGRVGESFPLEGERMTIGRRPESDIFLDDVTVSRDHALLVRRGGDYYLDDLRLAQRHLRQPPAGRVPPARGRRRAPDRQVQAHLPLALDGLDDPRSRRRDPRGARARRGGPRARAAPRSR